MYLSKQQTQAIIDNGKARGLKGEDVLNGLIERGYTPEGIDVNQAKTLIDAKKSNNGNVLQEAGGDVSQTVQDISSSLEKRKQNIQAIGESQKAGKTGFGSALGQKIGEIAGGGTDIIGGVLKGAGKLLLPQSTEEQIGGAAKGFATGVAKGELSTARGITDISSGVANVAVGGINKLLGTKIPNVPSLGGDALGGGTLKAKSPSEMAGKVAEFGAEFLAPVGAAAETTGMVGKIGSKVGQIISKSNLAKDTARTIEMLSPKLTAKETAEAVAKRGTTKSGLLGDIKLNVDPYVQKIAGTVKELVPEFNPSKTASENVNFVKDAIVREAEKLKSDVVASGKDILYPFKELAARFNSVEKPIAIKSDATLSRQFDLAKEAALKIAQKNGGKLSNLLDARKEFDALVQKEFPNLYDKENAPMRSAITSMRNAMNDFLAEKLPDVKLKDSLTKQSHLFDAVDNLASNIASGAKKEIGTNVIQRATDIVKKHPIVTGLGAYEAGDVIKKMLHL